MTSHKLRVEAALPQDTNHVTAGELEVINNEVDSTTGTVLLRAAFPNQDEILWPGQFANITLTLGQLTNATVVPAAAVQASQSGEFVFVVKPDSTVEKSDHTRPGAGRRSGRAKRVKPGETVVTDGQLRLVAGSSVNTKSPEAAPPGKPAGGGRP
jgi:multidrug efflux system membrane fusion protein